MSPFSWQSFSTCAPNGHASNSAQNYAQPLLDALEKCQVNDVPGHIENLKKGAGFKWDEVVKIPPNKACEVLGRNAIQFLIAIDRDQTPISEKARLDAIKSLLAAGQDDAVRKKILNELDNTGATALHNAAAFSRLAIVKLLVEYGADVDILSSGGVTPLHCATTNPDHEEIANFLIDSSAAIDIKAKNQQTPLHWAASHLRLEIVRRLLKLLGGLDRLPYDETLATPLEYARIRADRLRSSPMGTDDQARANDVVEALSQSYKAPGAKQSEWDDTILAHLFVSRRQQEQQQAQQQAQPQFTFSRNSYRKPVGEVLCGPSAWLAQASRLNWEKVPGQGLGRLVSVQGLLPGSILDKLACWIHLPANDVCRPIAQT